jgi:hypothetical protein
MRWLLPMTSVKIDHHHPPIGHVAVKQVHRVGNAHVFRGFVNGVHQRIQPAVSLERGRWGEAVDRHIHTGNSNKLSIESVFIDDLKSRTIQAD